MVVGTAGGDGVPVLGNLSAAQSESSAAGVGQWRVPNGVIGIETEHTSCVLDRDNGRVVFVGVPLSIAICVVKSIQLTIIAQNSYLAWC